MRKEEDSQPLAEEHLSKEMLESRYDLRKAKRCGAKCKRTGLPCQQPAMPNGRCRMHGGPSPGAPKGNKNAWKHGRRSKAAMEERAMIRKILAESKAFMEGLKG